VLEVTEQPGIEEPSGVLVKSTPRTMASAITEVASVIAQNREESVDNFTHHVLKAA
jgi:hypothetical protein